MLPSRTIWLLFLASSIPILQYVWFLTDEKDALYGDPNHVVETVAQNISKVFAQRVGGFNVVVHHDTPPHTVVVVQQAAPPPPPAPAPAPAPAQGPTIVINHPGANQLLPILNQLLPIQLSQVLCMYTEIPALDRVGLSHPIPWLEWVLVSRLIH
ncbi:hypothetical protein KEM48_003382 [Puccinia striiformis f. sp. tritici PST-130]|nr:hypothetical protein KEM48_003382 [Puccinia striiformis f. sp. tritici PST-130]